MFGAVGDGRADDSRALKAAFAAACDAAITRGRRTAVHVRANTVLAINYNTTLKGPCGPGVTIRVRGS